MSQADPTREQPDPKLGSGSHEVGFARFGGSCKRKPLVVAAGLLSVLGGGLFFGAGRTIVVLMGLYLVGRGLVSSLSLRRRMLRLELVVGSAYLALLAGELVIGGWPEIPSKNPMGSLRGLFIEDAKTEFRNAANFSGVFDDGIIRAPFRTNSLGDRDDEPGPEIDGECRLLLLGDSFAFGWGLTRNQTIEKQLEVTGGGSVDAYNLGVIAYNADKVLARFEAADWWRGTAVLYLFFNNDLVDPKLDSLVIRDGYLVNRADQQRAAYYSVKIPVTEAALFSILGLRKIRERLEVAFDRERALAVWPWLYSPATIANAVSKTEAMERLARHRGARFVAVILPTRGETEWHQYSKSTRAYLDGLAAAGIDVLEPRDELDPGDYFATDGHFNPHGAHKTASLIWHWLQMNGMVPRGSQRAITSGISKPDRG